MFAGGRSSRAIAFLGKPFPEDRMLAALRAALKTN
jgi:hypothetical protein